MLHIIVCMKTIIDPEMPLSLFQVDREKKRPIPPSGMPPVFSPYDENALEAALRLKEGRGAQVTVLSLGRVLPKSILQMALAVGADRVVAVEDPAFENLDAFSTARALGAAIKRIGNFDLVFTGRQSADWDAGLVWAGIAELLDIPSVTLACRVEILDGKAIVERCVSDGIEILEMEMPALMAFSSEGGELRNIPLPALMKAKKLEIPKWTASDLGFEREEVMSIKDFCEPVLELTECEMMPGETPEEKGRNVARRFVELGLTS